MVKWEVCETVIKYTGETIYYVVKIEYARFKHGGARYFSTERAAQKLADKLNAEEENHE